MKKSRILAFVALAASMALASCEEASRDVAQTQANDRAQNFDVYVQKHNIEFDNYNKRQKMSDDPTTVVWCTFFPPTPGVQPITIPVVGKLTSGNKRVFREVTSSGAESSGPDGMFGSSAPYRYGFTPGDVMVDIYDMPSFCSTQPTVWQRAKTEIVVAIDPKLQQVGQQVQTNLKMGSHQGAYTAAAAAAN